MNLFSIGYNLIIQWAGDTQSQKYTYLHMNILLILLPRIFLLAFLSLSFVILFNYFWESLLIFQIFFIFYVTIYPLLFNLSCTFHEPLNIFTYDSGFLSLLVLFQSLVLLPLHSCVPVYISSSADYKFYLFWLIIVSHLLWGVHGFELYLEHNMNFAFKYFNPMAYFSKTYIHKLKIQNNL